MNSRTDRQMDNGEVITCVQPAYSNDKKKTVPEDVTVFCFGKLFECAK